MNKRNKYLMRQAREKGFIPEETGEEAATAKADSGKAGKSKRGHRSSKEIAAQERVRAMHLGIKEKPADLDKKGFDMATWLAVSGPFVIMMMVDTQMNGNSWVSWTPLVSAAIAAWAIYWFKVKMNQLASRIWIGVFVLLIVLALFGGNGVPIWAYGVPGLLLAVGMAFWLAVKVGMMISARKHVALAALKQQKEEQ